MVLELDCHVFLVLVENAMIERALRHVILHLCELGLHGFVYFGGLLVRILVVFITIPRFLIRWVLPFIRSICFSWLIPVHTIEHIFWKRSVVCQASMDRLWKVTFEAFVRIFANFCTLLFYILVQRLALSIRKNVHCIWYLALLDNNFTVLNFTYFHIWRHNCERIRAELLEIGRVSQKNDLVEKLLLHLSEQCLHEEFLMNQDRDRFFCVRHCCLAFLGEYLERISDFSLYALISTDFSGP